MDSLMRRRQSPRATEALIKEALLCQLSHSVKEVQLLNSQHGQPFTSNEAANSLVVVLEAIFLHGLKRSIWRSALKSVQGVQETKPQPSFWVAVRTYTHMHTVDTIRGLSQISTDVGRSRVWVRIALNESALTSYIQAMGVDRRSINSNYNAVAFLRDRDICDTATKLLEGLITVEFNIPVNSSILNAWSNEPLLLSGIWAPSMKTPVSSAVDVAEGIEDDDDDTCSIRTSSSLTTLSHLAFDETQALRMILDTPIRTLEREINSVVVRPAEPAVPEEEQEAEISEEPQGEEPQDEVLQEVGGSVAKGWSSTGDPSSASSDSGQHSDTSSPPTTVAHAKTVPVPFKEARTYSSLLESYGTPPNSSTIDYRNILTEPNAKPTETNEEEEEYEIISDTNIQDFSDKVFKIAREFGLKEQNYVCSNCQLSIGLNFGEARYCYFLGKYYCTNCHNNDMSVIPSRLIFNWDHRKYPVCNEVSSYINGIVNSPLVDIKTLNGKLYSVVKEMRELRTLRFQLNMLKIYLSTCHEPVILEFQKKVWPREYIHDCIHAYSLTDLQRVPRGDLHSELSAVVTFARNHVVTCWLCSQKGFICELCKNPKVIYPFDCTSTYRCGKCHSVYHEHCLKSNKNCPKCKRRESRNLSRQDSLESNG